MVDYVTNNFTAVVHSKRLPLVRSPVQRSHTTPVVLLYKVALHAPRRVDVRDPLDY